MLRSKTHSLLLTIALVLMAAFVSARVSAAASAEVSWHYDTAVEPSVRPAWMEKVVLICESPWTDSKRQVLKPHIRRLKDSGFIVMNMYPDGFCRLDAGPHNDDAWRQHCLVETRAMHAQGMKVLAGVYPFVGSRGPRDLVLAHPEWRVRKNDAVPEAPGNGCLLSPYGQAVIERLVSRIREFDVDGFQFDGWYHCQFCRCPDCLANYRRDTGQEVPAKMDIADPAYLHYMVWRDKKLLDRMIQLRRAMHAVKPDAVIVNWNNIDAGKHVSSWMPPALDAECDWVNKEWWDSYDVSAIWLIKRLRASSGDRPAGIQPYMFMRHGYDVQSGVYHGSSAPSEEVLYRMHKVLATGSIPIVWPGARQAWTDADSQHVSEDLAEFLPLVHGTQTLKYAACLDSYTTLQMARQSPKQSDVLAHRGGVARALLEAHVPFDVIAEHNLNLERLSAYKVLVLPNTACMSDRLVQLIQRYVAQGGGLVATYESSLYDTWGDRRADFGLKDLFGASYVGAAETGPSRIGFSPPSHPITGDPAIERLTGARGMTTYWGTFARVKTTSTAMAASLVGVTVEKDKEDHKAGASWVPLLAGNYQAGRVAYFPAAIDAAYYKAGYPYERMLLVNAVRWAAGAEPSVRVVAPMCVQAECLTQQWGRVQRIIVHLLNDINTTTGHGSQEEKQYSFREEFVPLSGMKVTFSGRRPTRIVFFPGKQELDMVRTGDGWSVAVPPLALHGAVVAEYQQSRD